MMSVTQVMKGAFITVYPFMAQFLLAKFGYRGALTVITAVHSHVIFAMMLMHPVEWHMKRIKLPIEEIEPCKCISIDEFEKEVCYLFEKRHVFS